MINIKPERAYFIGIYTIPIKLKASISTLGLKEKRAFFYENSFKSIYDCPTNYFSSNQYTHYMLSQASAFHWNT